MTRISHSSTTFTADLAPLFFSNKPVVHRCENHLVMIGVDFGHDAIPMWGDGTVSPWHDFHQPAPAWRDCGMSLRAWLLTGFPLDTRRRAWSQ